MVDFYSVINDLQSSGFINVVMPFLLVFTIVFAILEKTKLLGLEGENPKTNINAVLALVISFIFISNTDLGEVIRTYISNVGLLIIIALLALILFGLLGVNVGAGFRGIPLLIAVILGIIGIIWSLKDQTYLGINFGGLGSGGQYDSWIITGIIVFIIVIAVTKPFKGSNIDVNKFSEGVDKQFGKGGSTRRP